MKPFLVHERSDEPGSPVELLAHGAGIAALAPIPGRTTTLGFLGLGRRLDGSIYGETEVNRG